MQVNSSQNSIIKITLSKEEMGLTSNHFKAIWQQQGIPTGANQNAAILYVPETASAKIQQGLRNIGKDSYVCIGASCYVKQALSGASQNEATYTLGVLSMAPGRSDAYMQTTILTVPRSDAGTFLNSPEIEWNFYFLAA